MTKTIYVGLDVHAETIAVAVCEGRNVARNVGTIPNTPDAIRNMLKKLGKPQELQVCYEAGPTGYPLYWQLSNMGIHCDVVAPSLVPQKPGERIKTDRRDARKLAQAYRSGDLTAVFVPDAEHEALRDLVRAREAAKKDETRAKHRLSKYLLRYAVRPDIKEGRAWSRAWWSWLRQLKMPLPTQQTVLLEYILQVDHEQQRLARLDKAIDEAVAQAPECMQQVIEALQSMRGVAKLTAVTLVTEVGTFQRFPKASQLMSYTGLVPSEHSSGNRRRQGAITRTGNAHLRRILVEAAHHYRHLPRLSVRQKKQRSGLDPRIAAKAWEAQKRLHARYWKLSNENKPAGKVVTAMARELVGFIWDIGSLAEQLHKENTKAAA